MTHYGLEYSHQFTTQFTLVNSMHQLHTHQLDIEGSSMDTVCHSINRHSLRERFGQHIGRFFP